VFRKVFFHTHGTGGGKKNSEEISGHIRAPECFKLSMIDIGTILRI
jgi:hypothetical protein